MHSCEDLKLRLMRNKCSFHSVQDLESRLLLQAQCWECLATQPPSPFFLLAVIFYVCLQLFFCSVSRDCSAKCSFHGHCDKDENCTCDKGWSGSTCNIPTCIEECIHGYCDNTTWLCVCDPGVYGKMLCKTYFKLFMYPTYL